MPMVLVEKQVIPQKCSKRLLVRRGKPKVLRLYWSNHRQHPKITWLFNLEEAFKHRLKELLILDSMVVQQLQPIGSYLPVIKSHQLCKIQLIEWVIIASLHQQVAFKSIWKNRHRQNQPYQIISFLRTELNLYNKVGVNQRFPNNEIWRSLIVDCGL